MGNVTTIGLDLAKNLFQVQGVGADGTAVVRQRLTRGGMLKFFAKLPPWLVGIEACASSHYWARELVALGHDVKLMPAQYCETVRQAGQERRGRCRGDLRGGNTADHALRQYQNP